MKSLIKSCLCKIPQVVCFVLFYYFAEDTNPEFENFEKHIVISLLEGLFMSEEGKFYVLKLSQTNHLPNMKDKRHLTAFFNSEPVCAGSEWCLLVLSVFKMWNVCIDN